MPESRKRKKKNGKSLHRTFQVSTDIKTTIDNFYQHAEGVVNSFAAQIEKEPPPKMIYHYTNDIGLRGIIETGKLWFTDIFNQNDPSELRHGLNPAVEILEAEAAKGMPEAKLFADHVAKMLRGGIEQTAHYFVCCFSKADDDLGQWRAYADNGRGYAIGFDARMLESAFAEAKPGPGNMTFPITYGEVELREMYRQIISEVIPLVSLPRGKKLKSNVINEYMTELSVSLCVPILRASLFFKHKAYGNEQEYRFLQLFDKGPIVPDLKHRGRPYSLLRYREFDWRSAAPDSLKTIMLGPAADKKIGSQFAETCLREFHRDPGDYIYHSVAHPLSKLNSRKFWGHNLIPRVEVVMQKQTRREISYRVPGIEARATQRLFRCSVR